MMLTWAQKRPGLQRWPVLLGLAGLGLAVSILTVTLLSLELKWAVFGFLGILFPFVLVMVPDNRRYLLALLLFAIPLNADMNIMLHPSVGGTDSIYFGLTEILLLILIVQTLIQGAQVKYTHQLSGFPAITWPTLALFGFYALSMIAATDLVWSLFDMVALLKALLLFLVLANNIRSHEDLKLMLTGISLGVLFQAIIVALQFYKGSSLNLAQFGIGEPASVLVFDTEYLDLGLRPGGTIGHCNHLGRYFGFLLPISFILALTSESAKMRWLARLVSIAGVVSLIFTFTRSSWLGLLISIMVMIPFMITRHLMTFRVLRTLAIGSVIVLIVLLPFSDMIYGRIFNHDMGSAKTRLTTAKVALDIIRDHPLIGIGINNSGAVLNEYWDWRDTFTRKSAVHNIYLLYASEIGLLGLSAYLILLGALFSRIRRATLSRVKFSRSVAIGVLASFVAFLLASLTDKGYKENFTLLLTLFTLAALIEGIIRLDEMDRAGFLSLVNQRREQREF